MAALLLVLIFLVAAALFVAAAKTHGRQVRLERELQGFDHVDFRRDHANPPWVEDVWRRDRVAYWSVAAGAAFLFSVGALAAASSGWRLPPWATLVLLPLLAMVAAFLFQALASLSRLQAARLAPPVAGAGPTARHGDLDWARAAERGTRLLLVIDAALVGALIALVLVEAAP